MQNFILLPAVGAIIGALTNDIAIRMLFRPYTEKRIFGCRIPFTPGLIPSQRKGIAANIAEVFERHLLSNEEIHKMFTSTAIHAELEQQLRVQIKKLVGPGGRISEEQSMQKISSELQNTLCNFAPEWLDQLMAEKARPLAEKMIDEAFQSLGPLAAFAGGFKGKIVERIITGVEEFSKEAGKSLANESTREKISSALSEQIEQGKLEELLLPLAPQIADTILTAIEHSMKKAVADGSLDIRQKVEDKINSLPVSQLEEIILGFSRQQFRYISLFGGLIGALIGLIQAFIIQA